MAVFFCCVILVLDTGIQVMRTNNKVSMTWGPKGDVGIILTTLACVTRWRRGGYVAKGVGKYFYQIKIFFLQKYVV